MKFYVTPWAHQTKIIDRAITMDDYAIFAEMGTGKSMMAVNILRYRCYEQKRMLRTLILAPAAVLENWRREIRQHSKMGSDTTVLFGAGARRRKLFNEKAFDLRSTVALKKGRIFVTNYEALSMKSLAADLERWQPEVIIFDESHRLKNPKSKRADVARRLADNATHRYILTGTPITNSPMDIWGQFRVLDGGRTFDKNFWAFRSQWFHDENGHLPRQKYFPKWVPKPGVASEWNRLIYAKATRVMKSECLDLPPLVKVRHEVALFGEQARAYADMRDHLIAWLGEQEDTASPAVAQIALTKALRLQQIVSGFVPDDGGRVHRFPFPKRLDALRELIEGIPSDASVIIWSAFRENHEMISEMLDREKLSHCMLVGGMTDKQRQKNIDAFQAGELRVMVANQQAGGIGINLTRASYAIYYSRNFSLEADLQSEARNHRGGSERHERITRIDMVTPDTIDQACLNALAGKVELSESIIASLRDLA